MLDKNISHTATPSGSSLRHFRARRGRSLSCRKWQVYPRTFSQLRNLKNIYIYVYKRTFSLSCRWIDDWSNESVQRGGDRDDDVSLLLLFDDGGWSSLFQTRAERARIHRRTHPAPALSYRQPRPFNTHTHNLVSPSPYIYQSTSALHYSV